MGECPLWNQALLTPPPYVTLKPSQNQRKQVSGKIQDLKCVLDTNLVEASILERIRTEGAFLSRWLYKLQVVFRQDKARSVTTKIYRSLKRFTALSLWKELGEFAAHVKQVISNGPKSDPPYLPVQQQLQYYLVRLQGTAELTATIILACRDSGYLMLDKIYMGHFASESMLCLSNLGRIWSIFQAVLLRVINIYNAIRAILPSFPASQATWLPPNYDLPEELELWLARERHNADMLSLLRANLAEKGAENLFWRKLGLTQPKSEIIEEASFKDSIDNGAEAEIFPYTEEMDMGESLAREELNEESFQEVKKKKNKKRKKSNAPTAVAPVPAKVIKMDDSKGQDCLELLFSSLITPAEDLGEVVSRTTQPKENPKKRKNRKKIRSGTS